MSSRERWIVYPLLFLTLGIAMRDKVIPPRLRAQELAAHGEVLADTVRCNHLEVGQANCRQLQTDQARCRLIVVADEDRKSAVRLGVVPDLGGRFELFSPEGKMVLVAGMDPRAEAGMLETLSVEGEPRVQLGATDDGGAVIAVGHAQPRLVLLGHQGKQGGVFAENPKTGRLTPLTLPWDLGEMPLESRPQQSFDAPSPGRKPFEPPR